MTDKDKTCDVCGHSELYVGVACSGLGAFSCAWCSLCIPMAAEMKFMIEGTVESCGGIDGVSPDVPLNYFDKERDAYINYRTNEIVPIITEGAGEFQTRSAWFESIGWKKVDGKFIPPKEKT